MSLLLGGTTTSVGILGAYLTMSDERTLPEYHKWGIVYGRSSQSSFGDGVLWPNSRGMGGQLSGNVTNDATTCSGIFELWPGYDESGGQQQKKIIGTTLDASGNPLASCVIQCYLTSNDVFVGQVTSDSGGYYELPSYFSAQTHYLVAYKPGAPDVAGTSVNTIVPV
jgi:hypothetical protein